MDKQINMFPIGSVVYYIKDDYTAGDNRFSVDFGIVNGYLSSREIQVEMYDICEYRTINNIVGQENYKQNRKVKYSENHRQKHRFL